MANSKLKTLISHRRLTELFRYDPDTGSFFRLIKTAPACNMTGPAGSFNGAGYVELRIDRQHYYAHRLAWFYVYGEWPDILDHIDRDKSNNCIANLRAATKSQNAGNLVSKRRKRGLKGANRSGENWYAKIRINGQDVYLGYFSTEESAHEAYMIAARAHFGEFANPG